MPIAKESQAKGAQALRQAILNQARNQASELLHSAQAVADSIEQQARQEAEVMGEEIRERAQRETAREKQRAIAEAQLEIHRRSLNRREELIADVLREARERLAALRRSDRYPAVLHGLIVEAATALGSGDLRVSVGREDAALLDDAFLAEAAGDLQDTSLERGDPLPESSGGVLLERADGSVRYDNTFDGRLERSWDRLRAEIYRILTVPN